MTGTMAAEGAAGPGSLTAEKGAVEPGNIAAEEGAAVTGAAAAEGAGTWRMQMPTWIRWLAVRAVFLAGSAGAVYGLGRLAKYLHSDYSYGGVVLILILYLLRDYRISALFISWIWLSWYNKLELYAAPAFFLLACYNGKRGEQSKRFFYVFYPAHLTALWLLRLCIFRQ